MKTYTNLYNQIISFENLYWASIDAAKGKRKKQDVADFLLNQEKEVLKLKNELESGNYRPAGYKIFFVREYNKERRIAAALFRDRVVHHAFCRIIEPIFDKKFIFHSFACRVDKGMHRGIKYAQKYLRQNSYAFQGDIVKYFDNINHDILLEILMKKIKDKKTINLARLILQSWESDFKKGVPVGNLTSQFFANLYLNELDYFVKFELRQKHYCRYMDDFILFGKNKKELWNLHKKISNFLTEKLLLSLHQRKSVIYPCRIGSPFLGFKIFSDLRRIKNANLVRFMWRVRKVKKEYLKEKIKLSEIVKKIKCWVNHASFGNTYCLRKNIFSKLILNK